MALWPCTKKYTRFIHINHAEEENAMRDVVSLENFICFTEDAS